MESDMRQIQVPALLRCRMALIDSVVFGILIGSSGCHSAEPLKQGDGGSPQGDSGPPQGDSGPSQGDSCSPNLQEAATLLPAEAVANEHLGFSVAASGDNVAVGAKDSNRSQFLQSGAVIVFERDKAGAWPQSAVLIPSDAQAGDNFGFSIALSGNVLAVGAPFSTVSDIQTGAVYIFNKAADGRWVESVKLGSPSGGAFDIFGQSVAIDGDRLVVGAFQAGDEQQGTVFVYERDGSDWRLDATLQASDGMPNAKFGIAVAVFGDRILVGAESDSHLVPGGGSAYVFEKTSQGWSEISKLLPADPDRADFFGFSVALSQDSAVVGTYLKKDAGGNTVGAAYVFRNTGLAWMQQEKIVPSDAMPGDEFGMSISIANNIMAIGAPRNDGAAPNAGAVYLFQQADTQWKPLAKLYQAASHENNEYGRAVTLSDGGFVVAGAWLAASSQPEAGSSEIAAVPPCPQH